MRFDLSWHGESAEKVLAELETNQEYGLSEEETALRLEKFGKNVFKRKEKFRFLKLLFRQIESPLVLILIIAGLISVFLFKDYSDAAIIFSAVFLNTLIGIIQEGKAGKIFEKLKTYLSLKSNVLREGKIKKIDSSELVPGDILILFQGEKVGADGRLIEARNLEINESALSGEWLANTKENKILAENTPLADRVNMVYAGTIVESGFGKAIITATDEYTEIGKISEILAEEKKEISPFQKGVKSLAKIITIIIALFTLLIFGVGILRGFGFEEMFLTAIAVAVAGIPEGLPVAITVILALGMERILHKGGLIRRLSAAETLGSTDVIIVDKTGTLTQAKMAFGALITKNHKISSYEEIKNRGEPEILTSFKSALFANSAFIENPGANINELIIQGEPTEKAMLESAINAGLNYEELLKNEPRIDFLDFHPERRWSASLHQIGEKRRIYLAGAPETVLRLSDKILDGSKPADFGEADKKRFHKEFEKLTENGARIIALAYKEDHYKALELFETPKIFSDFVFLGFLVFEDPIREDIFEAVKTMKEANVKIVMATGDHRGTAKAVAKKIGIADSLTELKIMEGEELEKLSEKALSFTIDKIDVFARTTPRQKLKILEAFLSRGYTAAMTGDGVNDAPSLRRANIGISVGSGTEVAKEASDLILINDGFAIISRAIEEGRIIIDNLKKVLVYLLSTGFMETVLIGLAIFGGFPLPLLPGQILWANLVGEGFMNFAFAFEKKDDGIMRRHPRDYSLKKILNSEIIKMISVIGIITSFILLGLFLYLFYSGVSLEKTRTIIFAGLNMASLFFAFSIKNLNKPIWKIKFFSNWYLIGAWFLSVALLLAALFLPPLQKLLKLVPLNSGELLLILSLGFANLFVIETVKWYNNKNLKFL